MIKGINTFPKFNRYGRSYCFCIFSTFNNAINFDLIKSEISASYKLKSINFDGNRYYFEEPKKASLELFDGRKIKNLLTNYNLFDQVFEVINNENQKVKLPPNKISKVFFSDNSFISLNGKFYESIESNENFSLLADTFLEAYIVLKGES